MNYTGSSFSLLKSSFLSSVWKNCVSIFFILLVLPLWERIHSKTFFCSLSHISSYEIVPMPNQHVTNFTCTEIKVEKNRVMWPKGLCKEYLGNSLLLKGLSISIFFQYISLHLTIFQFSVCSDSVPSREWPGSSYDTGLRNDLPWESELNLTTKNKAYGHSNPELDMNFVVGVVWNICCCCRRPGPHCSRCINCIKSGFFH